MIVVPAEEAPMTAVPKRKLTPAEYLAIERKAEFKSEFLDGEMFAMAGASFAHNAIKDNLIVQLGSQLKGGPCRTLSSDMRVKVSATGLYTYPDVIILCGPAELEDANGDTLLNPQVIIEVLSESTAGYDQGRKYRHYQRLESLREYILVAQDEPAVERRVRQSRWDWLQTTFAGLDGELELATVPAKIPLADIYAGVTFPDPPKPPAGRPR
jgi:Uma2 family endonuclease